MVLTRDPDDYDGHFYTLATRSILRGKIAPVFQVWEANDNGRASFDWIEGTDYVLFLSDSKRDHAWQLDGCGNSGPLSQAATALAAIKAAQMGGADALVDGMVSADGAWTAGVPYVTVRAAGNGTAFTAKADEAGRFQMRLPAGRYRLKALRSGWSFKREFFGYENPGDLRLSAGSCAQVQFDGHKGN